MFRTQIKASVVAANQERSPEFSLWKAVIAQAITDAKYNGLRKNYLECKRLAIIWFSSFSKDFKAVCQYADIDPDYANALRKAVKNKLNILCYDCKFSSKGIKLNKKIKIKI